MIDCGEIKPSKLAAKKAKYLEVEFIEMIRLHCAEQWPFITDYEKMLNKQAIEKNGLVYSRYKIKGEVFFIQTDLKTNQTFIHMVEE